MRWLLQLGLPLLAGIGLFTGVLYSGRFLGDQLRGKGTHVFSFADLDCVPPNGMTRLDFLHEVQYLAELPDKLELLEGQTPSRISRALSLHPWVARVNQVKLVSGGLVQAEIVYREPILVVEPSGRVVDGEGVLLPQNAPSTGLPRLATPVAPPGVTAGHTWADVRVRAAAQVVVLLRPRLHALGLADCKVSIRDGDVILDGEKCRLVWGRPPDHEKAGEATALTKLQWLPPIDSLNGWEWDVRPATGMKKRRR